MLTTGDARDLAGLVAAIVAGVTLLKALREYRRQGLQHRVEQFLTMRSRFKDNEHFSALCELLDAEEDADGLADYSYRAKRDLVGFFEELALMVNSEVLRLDVVHYMFGHYIIRCRKSKAFWSNMAPGDPYWAQFMDFADQLIASEQSFTFRRGTLKL
jgi:hypothetical protein